MDTAGIPTSGGGTKKNEPMDVAIMVTLSEAKELLSFLGRVQSRTLERDDYMTTLWMQNATSRAIHRKEDS